MKKRRQTYQSKLFLLVTSLLWLTIVVFVTFSLIRDQQHQTDLLNSKMQSMNEVMLKHYKLGSKWAEIEELYPEIRVTVVDFDGNVIYDSVESIIGDNHSNRNEIKHAMVNNSGYTIRRASIGDEREYFYSATKGDDIVIRSALPYDASLYDSLRIDYAYIGILLAIGVVVTIIVWMFLGRATQSIRVLKEFAINASRDINFNPHYFSLPNDEFKEIAEEILLLHNKQKESNNDATAHLNQLLIEEQEKARIKQQLSSNINHELKTPIHIVSACLETIQTKYDNLSPEMIRDLVDKSMNQTKRLIALVNDLSLITRLTDGKHQISMTKLNLSAIISKVTSEIELIPLERRMRIHLSIPENLEIEGNADLLESVFRNLMINSLDYSGGRDIFIEYLGVKNGALQFRFADNGIGVSNEHLSKIFERFYRPDEGRNRKTGGTGLGLSIVKNSILTHNGEIIARNIETGGLEFLFSLSITNKN